MRLDLEWMRTSPSNPRAHQLPYGLATTWVYGPRKSLLLMYQVTYPIKCGEIRTLEYDKIRATIFVHSRVGSDSWTISRSSLFQSSLNVIALACRHQHHQLYRISGCSSRFASCAAHVEGLHDCMEPTHYYAYVKCLIWTPPLNSRFHRNEGQS